MSVPLIIDTDVGGDPDDAVALVAAARTAPELALVVTSDEAGGERARLARRLLDLCGRRDVAVVEGADVGSGSRYFCCADLCHPDVPRQRGDVPAAVAGLAAVTTGPLRWVGLGPMTNLARVLDHRPELAGRLLVTQMGGALRYRDPGRAEHNLRLDPAAAARVLRVAQDPEFVTSEVTFRPELAVGVDSGLYRTLAGCAAPWSVLVRRNFDRWFAAFHETSMMHDPLAFSAASGLPFVAFGPHRVGLDPLGRMTERPDGHTVRLSHRADYAAFRRWLAAALTPD